MTEFPHILMPRKIPTFASERASKIDLMDDKGALEHWTREVKFSQNLFYIMWYMIHIYNKSNHFSEGMFLYREGSHFYKVNIHFFAFSFTIFQNIFLLKLKLFRHDSYYNKNLFRNFPKNWQKSGFSFLHKYPFWKEFAFN